MNFAIDNSKRKQPKTKQDYINILNENARCCKVSYIGALGENRRIQSETINFKRNSDNKNNLVKWYIGNEKTDKYKEIYLIDLSIEDLRKLALSGNSWIELREDEYPDYPTNLQLTRFQLEKMSSLLASGEYIIMMDVMNNDKHFGGKNYGEITYTVAITKIEYNKRYAVWQATRESGLSTETINDFNTLDSMKIYKRVFL